MNTEETINRLEGGGFDGALARLCASRAAAAQRERLRHALDEFARLFGGGREVRVFSAPGRIEIGGNHTDHQRGRVLAAAIDLDILCVASPNTEGVIRIKSREYSMDELDTGSLKPREGERGKSVSLIRGVAAQCRRRGYELGGFDAYTVSDVLKGSGLSSSAAFEVAVGTMINGLFNGGAIPAVEIAMIGRYAENHYFGKPSGLMDQMASSVGGCVAIDFADPEHPVIESIDLDLTRRGYAVCVLDTGDSHADLTGEYAAIPAEMLLVARQFGKEVLRDEDWVMVASHRQSRPQMPADWCPFCPGSGRVPAEGFDVLRYPNDFPALSATPPEPDDVATGLFKIMPAYGRCEVILYSDRHTANLRELSDAHVYRLAELWQEIFNDLSSDPQVKYVYIFENRGEVVGVTMPHPHGQVYAYPYLPKRLEQEALSAREYFEATGRNLFADLLAEEKLDGRRIVFENRYFTAYVPFFSPVTYGVSVCANRQLPHIGAMTGAELGALGETVRDCAGMYDSLFGTDFPYMMCMHNAPVNSGDYSRSWQFHIEYFPPMRAADKQQFFASSETGASAWCNPNSPEEKAAELRAAYGRFCGNRRSR